MQESRRIFPYIHVLKLTLAVMLLPSFDVISLNICRNNLLLIKLSARTICMTGETWSKEAVANFRAGSFQNHLQLWEDLFSSGCPAPTDPPGNPNYAW